MPWSVGTADAPPMAAPWRSVRFFSKAELDFIEPAIDRLIPPDGAGPSASQADVHVFLDRQLAGLYGRGDHFYLGGPWPKGTPEQGYQSRLSPAQFYRAAIPAIERHRSPPAGQLRADRRSTRQPSAGQQDRAC